jgi:hypothetical protein
MDFFMSKTAAIFSLIFMLFAPLAHAEDQSIRGAWKLVEVTTPDGVKNPSPQPSLWIFIQNHYSLAIVMGTKIRPQFSRGQATDAEKIATYDGFTANSGTYSVSGNMLTTIPVVAANEYAMTNGFLLKYEMRFEGNDAVSLTTKVGGGVNSVWKLQRVE